MNKEQVKQAAKYVGAGVAGAGVAAAGATVTDNPTQNQTEDLQNQVTELEETVNDKDATIEDLETEVDNLNDRPTQEEYQELQKQVAEMFTQEEVNEMLEREDLIEYLPVLADEEVEITSLGSRDDVEADQSSLNNDVPAVEDDFDDDEFEHEDFDEVTGDYTHEDGHDYDVVAREFEDSEDADVYEEGLRDAVEDEEYDETLDEDAEVIRDGDTVIYIHGNADEADYSSYDFEAVTSQY